MMKSNKYVKTILMGINDAMQYRLNFMLGLISIIFPITIQIYIWNAVYYGKTDSVVYGFSYKQMILYTLLSAIVSKFVASDGFEGEINQDIKDGGLNKYLIKPVSYSKYRLSCSIGKKTPQIITVTIMIIAVLIVSSLVLEQTLEPLRIMVFFISICFATLLNLLHVYCISAAAFWVSDAGSFFHIASLVVNVFSGGVFPLEIFGSTLNRIFNYLPYKYTIYYPVTIVNGRLESARIIEILGLQIFWIVVLILLSKVFWKIGMKKYNAIGG